MALNYAKLFNRRMTPEARPNPWSTQVANSGEGDLWQVDDCIEYVNALRGWGWGCRNVVGRWYLEQEAHKLAHRVVKDQQQDLAGQHPPASGVGPV